MSNPFQNKSWPKIISIFISLLLICTNHLFFSQESDFKGLFAIAKQQYWQGKYRNTIDVLESILAFFPSDQTNEKLKSQIYLLLGAAYEKRGDQAKATHNYNLALTIVQDVNFADLDFTYLPLYQKIILKKKNPQSIKVIEKEGKKSSQKKRIIRILLAAAILAGIITILYLVLKKEPEENNGSNPTMADMDITWIKIPAGHFQMGDNFNEGHVDENPVHTVFLKEYEISKHEISCQQFLAYLQDTNKDHISWKYLQSKPTHPVSNVSWENANLFCQWLSSKTGQTIHLPTEAQWEKAARGIDQRRYPWGNQPPSCDYANHCCMGSTQPCGSFTSGNSPYGLSDMAGNVAEWCQDHYAAKYYQYSEINDPQGPAEGDYYTFRVIRGGSYICQGVMSIRSADRYYLPLSTSLGDLGFRIVREIE